MRDLADADLEILSGYNVSLLAHSDRLDGLSAENFALECVVCGKEVTGDGVAATVDGEAKTSAVPPASNGTSTSTSPTGTPSSASGRRTSANCSP